MVIVGKYTSPMDPTGENIPFFIDIFISTGSLHIDAYDSGG